MKFIIAILATVFITLKLANVIAWPWIWVLAPIWIPLAIFIVFIILLVLMVKSID